jgi:hypothetical protein
MSFNICRGTLGSLRCVVQPRDATPKLAETFRLRGDAGRVRKPSRHLRSQGDSPFGTISTLEALRRIASLFLFLLLFGKQFDYLLAA